MKEKNEVFTAKELEELSKLIEAINPNNNVLSQSKAAIEEAKKIILTLSTSNTTKQKEEDSK